VKNLSLALCGEAYVDFLAVKRYSNNGVASEERINAIATIQGAKFSNILRHGLQQINETNEKNAHDLRQIKEQNALPRFNETRRRVYSIRCGAVTFVKSMQRSFDFRVGMSMVLFVIALFSLLLLFIYRRREKTLMAVLSGILVPTAMDVILFLWNCQIKAAYSTFKKAGDAVEVERLRVVDLEVESNNRNG